jgi:hypothetical protein
LEWTFNGCRFRAFARLYLFALFALLAIALFHTHAYIRVLEASLLVILICREDGNELVESGEWRIEKTNKDHWDYIMDFWYQREYGNKQIFWI